MSSYDQLPIELKENILKYVSPEEYSNMMLTSKSNLYVGKGGKSSYIRNNLPYRTVTMEADNWLDICNDPLVLRFELDNIIYDDYNEYVVMQISGRFFEENIDNFLYGNFDVVIEYVVYDNNEIDELDGLEEIVNHDVYHENHEVQLKCNFKNNKLEGLYYVIDTVNDGSIINYREYIDGIKVSDVYFNGMLSITLRDQFGRPYKKYIYECPIEYINKDILFEHYPDLDVLHINSYDKIKNFVNNVVNGNYQEFELTRHKLVDDNVFMSSNKYHNIVEKIPLVNNMTNEYLNSLFDI